MLDLTLVEDRFWAKVDKDGPIPEYAPDLGPCWLWVGGKSHGYGEFGSPPRRSHRLAYEWMVSPIPQGLVLDHLCRVTSCMNPAHLEPVTQRENIMRGTGIMAVKAAQTHCVRGHPLDAANTRITPKGRRRCRACHRLHEREYRIKRGGSA